MPEGVNINSFIGEFIRRLRRQKIRDITEIEQIHYLEKETREENVPLSRFGNFPGR